MEGEHLWEELYAELVNKFRWSIGTASGSAGINLSYQEQRAISTVLAGDALAVLKEKDTSPEWRPDATGLRAFLRHGAPTTSPPVSPPEGEKTKTNGRKPKQNLTA